MINNWHTGRAGVVWIIRERKRQKRDTFVYFVDFSAAFDNIRPSLLLTKAGKYGVNGNFHKALCSLYSTMYGTVTINGYLTN